jgi:hypothetical protein
VAALGASAIAKKNQVTVLLTSSTPAPIAVVGKVKLGKGRSATLSGGTRLVAPGAIAKFKLTFPKALKAKLKLLSSKQRLSLTVTATATNIASTPSVKSLNVKLKGQAKPKHKRR